MCRHCSDPSIKLTYTPLEAALRWCGLMVHQDEIAEARWLYAQQLLRIFPQWPCLAQHVALILDAIRHDELPTHPQELFTGTDSETGPSSFRIRHNELKAWMSLFHPDQKPPFLFACTADSGGTVKWGHYLALKADRDTLQRECKRLGMSHAKVVEQLAELGIELEQLRATPASSPAADARSEPALLDLVGAMLRVMLTSHFPKNNRPFFASQDAIVSAIQEQFPDHPGFGKRTVDQRFAEANKRFKQAH